MKQEKPTIAYNPPTNANHRWIENVSRGLRVAGYADEINQRLRHTGWFMDQFCHEKTRGIVVQLPSRHGKTQYVPGNTNPWNDDCAVLDFSNITDDKKDAASWADSMAESYAEEEREYSAKQQAEMDIEQAKEDITISREKHTALIGALQRNFDPLAACAVRAAINHEREIVHSAVKIIRDRNKNYWTAIQF